MSKTLQEYFICGTPWCTRNRARLTNTQNFSLVEVTRVYPWLAMLRDRLIYTTHADQLNRLRTAGRPTGLIFTNDRCSLIYMNGCEL